MTKIRQERQGTSPGYQHAPSCATYLWIVQRTSPAHTEATVTLQEKSSLLLLNKNNETVISARSAFLNVASFRKCLKMSVEVCFSLRFISSNTSIHNLSLHRGSQCSHFLKLNTLLVISTLMKHYQCNAYNYFAFQLLLCVLHCLSKFGRWTQKIHVRLYISIKLSTKK